MIFISSIFFDKNPAKYIYSNNEILYLDESQFIDTLSTNEQEIFYKQYDNRQLFDEIFLTFLQHQNKLVKNINIENILKIQSYF